MSHGKVTRVVDPGYGHSIQVTVRVDGYAEPVTIGLDWVEVIENGREPKVRDLRE